MKQAAAILLAAGESSRMKDFKPLLPWSGSTLLGYSIDSIIEAGYGPLVVVLGHHSSLLMEQIPKEVTTVINQNYRCGKSSSIKAGIHTLKASGSDFDSILIASVDQPRSVQLLRDLRESMQNSFDNALIASPVLGEKVGHPLILMKSLEAELLGISEETQGIRSVISKHRHNRILVPTKDPLALTNLNTITDYHHALSLVTS